MQVLEKTAWIFFNFECNGRGEGWCCIFQNRRGWRLLRWPSRGRLAIFTERNGFFLWSFYEIDSLFIVTWFLLQLQGKNSEVHGRLVLISNNYTKVSNKHRTFLFFCYDFNSSIYKNKLTLWKITLLKGIICFKDLSTF